MTLAITDWPFLPAERRTPEQNARWWSECHVPSPAMVTLRGVDYSVIARGGPGSGKSVALQALEKFDTEKFFMFRYPVAHWPGEPHAWVSGFHHLGQIMACASMEFKNFLTQRPDLLNKLTDIDVEFLRWLIEKYNGARAFRAWANALGHQEMMESADQPYEDLYKTDTVLSDVQNQIGELVTLCRHLGFEGAIVLIDINEYDIDREKILEKIKDLFGWLTPLQFEGFAIKAALPDKVVRQTELVDRSRGRITFTALRWTVEECRKLSTRHIQAATESQLKALTDIASFELLTKLEKKIRPLYRTPSPRVWLWLTKTLLDEYGKCDKQLTTEQFEVIVHTYFATYIPLKLDEEQRGVWRGDEEFITLEEQQYRFMELLWRYGGNRGDAAYNALLDNVAGSKGNLNTIASRLRKKIEPVGKPHVYIHNSRGQYWLENIVKQS